MATVIVGAEDVVIVAGQTGNEANLVFLIVFCFITALVASGLMLGFDKGRKLYWRWMQGGKPRNTNLLAKDTKPAKKEWWIKPLSMLFNINDNAVFLFSIIAGVVGGFFLAIYITYNVLGMSQ